MYKPEIMVHESGERLPMLVDEQGFPIIVPNEFALTRRGDAWRTIEKKLNHIALLHQWAKNQSIDLNAAVVLHKYRKYIVNPWTRDGRYGPVKALATVFQLRLTSLELIDKLAALVSPSRVTDTTECRLPIHHFGHLL